MWTDHETERDFLNFASIAGTVAEVIKQASPNPVSIGVSGAWGVGKSSLIRLIRNELSITASAKQGALDVNNTYVFVDFNAWLYQGYDDARAALLDIVATTLAKEAENRKKGTQRALEFVERVNLLRLSKMAASGAAAMAAVHPVVALAGALFTTASKVLEATSGQSEKKEGEASKGNNEPLLKPKKTESPPKEIQALRDSFEEVLCEMEITLIVLIDVLEAVMHFEPS